MLTSSTLAEIVLNPKQQELAEHLLQTVKSRYPEIEFLNLQRSPDDRNHIWLNVNAPMNEDREIELISYTAELCTNILLDYGYAFSVMPENPTLVVA
jgi:hypothetical protein